MQANSGATRNNRSRLATNHKILVLNALTRQGYASLAQVKVTNDDLTESMGLLCNNRDTFSLEAARPGDGNGQEYSYAIRTRQNVSKLTCEVNTTLLQAY